MNTRQEKLIAKIGAVNRANAEATRLHQIFHDIFAPFVGQKILKADGTLLAKVAALVPEFAFGNTLQVRTLQPHVYRDSSNYSLIYTVKACETMPPHSCAYHDTAMYIGVFAGAMLEKLSPVQTYRSDYVVEEIEGKRQAYESAKRVAEELRSALYPFGEHDN